MSEIQTRPEIFPDLEAADQYIQSVRLHYRNHDAAYQGQRTPEQRAIAELTADEAHLVVDGVIGGLMAVTSGKTLPEDYDSIELSNGHTAGQFRDEFTRLLVGFGIITNRLERDGFDTPSYIELGDADRMKVATSLFSDFLTHNGLRFGADSSGVMRTHRRHGDDGEIELVRVDPDKAKWQREINRNVQARGITSGIATHTAGKLSPTEYRELRLDFPEIDKDEFDLVVGASKNARKALEDRGQ